MLYTILYPTYTYYTTHRISTILHYAILYLVATLVANLEMILSRVGPSANSPSPASPRASRLAATPTIISVYRCIDRYAGVGVCE